MGSAFDSNLGGLDQTKHTQKDFLGESSVWALQRHLRGTLLGYFRVWGLFGRGTVPGSDSGLSGLEEAELFTMYSRLLNFTNIFFI